MSEFRHCPHCGAPMAIESGPSGVGKGLIGEPRFAKDADAEPDLPPVPLLAPGSNDDSFLGSSMGARLAAAEPDPILGEFVTPSPSRSASSTLEEPARGHKSSANFPSLNFDAPALSPTGPGRASKGEPESSEDYEGPEARGTPWTSVLLASYASAITLALGWTLMRDRAPVKVEVIAPPPPPVVLPASARQAELSGKVEPPEPILGDHLVKVGQPLKLGSLEVTPIEVKREDVALERSNVYAKPEKKAGGKKALVLRLRLKNLSNDSVFAPLDQAYLRERGKQVVDTFIQTAGDDRIYPYPLAVESEWSIVGQDFSELRPGETRVVSIVSAPDAPPDSLGPFTWRVRLRTGIKRTDTIGVRWPEKAAGSPKKVGHRPGGPSIGRL